MALSSRFKEMERRIKELRVHMLPKNFSPTGDYTKRQLDRTRGYRLLVHAEIESYLEDVAKSKIIDVIGAWKNNKRPTLTLLSFLAAYHSGWNSGDERNNEDIIELAKGRNKVKDSVGEAIDIAQRQYIRCIKSNHGIKEKNLKELMLPLGVDFDVLESTWLVNMDNFGKNRGSIAHNTVSATDQVNPQDELEAVRTLMAGIRELDAIISALD